MGHGRLEAFREYLQSLPDELLESVTEDYIWLSGLAFEREGYPVDFRQRRECCREECLRRGASYLYHFAESTVSPYAA